MQYVELEAPPALNDLVHCFWFLRGEFPPAEPQTIVADGRVEIVLHLAESFSRLEGGRYCRQETALVSGQITAPVVLAGNGTCDVVGIRFRTHAAAAFLRIPLDELNDVVAPLASLSVRMVEDLLAAARSSPSPHRRVSALAMALGRHIRCDPDPLAAMASAALSAPSPPRVEAMAKSLGTTTRTLERRLTIATGLPPAALRRVIRFRNAFRMLSDAPRGRWAEVASQCGYADQSHLIRDFRQFAGVPPTEFFATEPELALNMMGSDTGW